jgi:predicted esterase
MSGRWLAELAVKDDMTIYSVGDRGVKPNADGSTTDNTDLSTNNIETQKNDLLKLVDKLLKDPCVGQICVCGISQGGAVVAKAMSENEHLNSGVLISTPLDSMSKVTRFQRRRALMAWVQYYDLDAKTGLTKELFDSKPPLADSRVVNTSPANLRDAISFYGPLFDKSVALKFESGVKTITIEMMNESVTKSYEILENPNYDLKKDKNHLLPKDISPKQKKLLLKNASEVQANNSLSNVAKDIENMKGKKKSVILYHGANDSLIPIDGFADLNDLVKKSADYSYIAPRIVTGRGHDLLFFSGILHTNWLSGEIPDDPVRRAVLANIRHAVRGEKPE